MIYGESSSAKIMLSKIERHSRLSRDERDALLRLTMADQIVEPRRNIYREGQTLNGPFVLIYGYVFCHKVTQTGVRQIVSLHRPGDMVGMQSLIASVLDYGIQAATRAVIAWVPPAEFERVITASPNILRALIVESYLEQAIAREWFTNSTARSAQARVAHFVAEFFAREEIAGVALTSSSYLPFTQEQIGDATGLTSVHVNRMLRTLKEHGALASCDAHYTIADRNTLESIAGFNREYLQLRMKHPVANSD